MLILVICYLQYIFFLDLKQNFYYYYLNLDEFQLFINIFKLLFIYYIIIITYRL